MQSFKNWNTPYDFMMIDKRACIEWNKTISCLISKNEEDIQIRTSASGSGWKRPSVRVLLHNAAKAKAKLNDRFKYVISFDQQNGAKERHR